MEVSGEPVVSDPLHIRVTPPRGYEDEVLAQDFFTEGCRPGVIHSMAVTVLDSANTALQKVAEQLGDRRVAMHAQLALGSALARDHKELVVDRAKANNYQGPRDLTFKLHKGKPEEARKLVGNLWSPHQRPPSNRSVTCRSNAITIVSATGLPRKATRRKRPRFRGFGTTRWQSARQGRTVLTLVLNDIRERQEHFQAAAPRKESVDQRSRGVFRGAFRLGPVRIAQCTEPVRLGPDRMNDGTNRGGSRD